jgi:DNA primase/DNA-binding MarR family transcriptional regulator
VEILELKRQLSIDQVLGHYGLKPDQHHRLLCPFHPDKTPSLQVYPQTDTFCCFSTNCTAGTGDVIRLIELLDKCSTHEAILKAQLLIGAAPIPAAALPAGGDLDRLAVLAKVFQFFKAALPVSKKAASYLASRCLDYKQQEIGYNSGGLHIEAKNHYLVQSMVKTGLLKPNAVKGYNVWAKDCIVFPLRDKDHKIISLYGRSITNNSDQRHFYLSGRSGLYPGYPGADTTRLILTESIIDAESLLQQASIREQYAVLALYGTNGLTDEHITAIRGLQGLVEITLILDGDEAGTQATIKHAHTLRNLCPQVRIMQVALPDGEDINSLLQSHANAQVLVDLVAQRTDFSFSMEASPTSATPPSSAVPPPPGLDTRNAELLIYESPTLRIEVLGGIKLNGLDRLRVSLKVTCKGKAALPVWHSLDLYNHGQREQVISNLSEVFDYNVQATAETIARLTESLEHYRRGRIEALQTKAKPIHELTAAQAQAAINELKKPNLLDRTSQLISLSGIVGELTNGLIAYLVYTLRKSASPLHVMFMGASASGKTYLQEKVSELIPSEDKIEITQITGNALYYFKQEELKHKLILIEDLDGAMDVSYPLRELQTKKRITKTVTLKDSKGNLKTITLTVEGPVCVSGCTTKEKLYEDNANRCILLYIDASKEQDKRITEYQSLVASGEVNRHREQQVQQLFQHIQRVLKPVKVVNPFAKYIQLPEEVFKPRRTMTLLLSFIEAITFYHQYQREVKRDKEGQPYITTTPEDIGAAFGLLKEVLFTKSDELTRATRSFLEYLKTYLQAQGKDSFAAKEIRAHLRIPPSSLKRYLMELERYGYVKGVGNRYRNYEYTITSLDEYEQLKSSIDAHLASILEQIRQTIQWPSGSPVA